MASFKNITIKKRGGGTRKQRVQVLASGKFKFVKNLRNKLKRKSNPRPKKARKVKRKLAKRKRKRRSNQMTIPLALVSGVAASVARPLKTALETKDIQLAAYQLCEGYTGYYPGDGSFDVQRLKFGLVPLAMGALVHKFVGGSPLNVNRMLASAKIPFIRI